MDETGHRPNPPEGDPAADRGPRTPESTGGPRRARTRGGPVLSVLPSLPFRVHPVLLGAASAAPMPVDARGALVTAVGPLPDGAVHVVWIPRWVPPRALPGRLLLSWEHRRDARTDVRAFLYVDGDEVTLATWSDLAGEWNAAVAGTVAELLHLRPALCRAFRLLGGLLREDDGDGRVRAVLPL